ncbi:hypothetical protein JNJ66_07405 [Candidatus Saccharibacteria bacterium]|nr:hypothetical protein [Candidatus Saccharibacteria bacterium]
MYDKPFEYDRDGKRWSAQLKGSLKDLTSRKQTPFVVSEVYENDDGTLTVHVTKRGDDLPHGENPITVTPIK